MNITNNNSNGCKKHSKIKKSNMVTILAVFMVISLVLSSQIVVPTASASSPFDVLLNPISQSANVYQIAGINQNYNTVVLFTASKIGNLPLINMSDVKSFEQYHDLVDKFNAATTIVDNGKSDIHSHMLAGTQDEYEKISKFITKYSPGIKEYNGMVLSARNVNGSNQTSIYDFYAKSAVFAFVVTLTAGSGYSGLTYDIVRAGWTSSGITEIAFKCPVCVKFALGQAHWFIRNSFVGATANLVGVWLDMAYNLSVPEMLLRMNQFVSKFNPSNLLPQIHK